MSIVEEFFYQPIPAELWHYTSIEGFEGMLSSGAIWASEVRSSRDQTEFIHARKIAEDYLARQKPANKDTALGIETSKAAVAEMFETGWLSQDKIEVFVTSFSSASDRKSQWVDYSADGCGVAVVMDLRNVRPPPKSESAVTLAPCLYQTPQKDILIGHALQHFINFVRDGYRQAESLAWTSQSLEDWRRIDRTFNRRFDQEAYKEKMREEFRAKGHLAAGELSIDLFRLASHCKHDGYFEEHEWRLALPHTKGNPLTSTVEYRGATHIPYIAHRISGKPKLPIVRVVAGFACSQLERVKAVLEVNGYTVPVETSGLPEIRER